MTVGDLIDRLIKYDRNKKVELDADSGLYGVTARLMVESDFKDEDDPDDLYFETIMRYNSIFDDKE